MDRDAIRSGVVRVASAVPGRVRLQGDRSRRAALAAVAEELGTWPHVTSVDVRARSASIVVRFSPEHLPVIADGLLELGVDLDARLPTAASSSPPEIIAAAATAGNRAVGQRLGGTDLRTLVPLGLGLLAARRAMRGDERLADAPWYLLAWYATETFWRFHGDGGARDQAIVSASPPPR